jgi:predicted glycosyl hydrolase (DUF1957 family)
MSEFKSRNDAYQPKSYNQFKSYNDTKIIPKKDFEIKVNDFPELSKPNKNKSSNNVKSFTSLLKEEVKEEIKVEVKEEDLVPPGWVLYKYTKNKNELFGIKYSKITSTQSSNTGKKPELDNNNINVAEKIIIALSNLHEKRTNEYKELWGEDEWERMFLCPNYDYEYFDKLDEAYEIEEEKRNEHKYYDDDDYYSN